LDKQHGNIKNIGLLSNFFILGPGGHIQLLKLNSYAGCLTFDIIKIGLVTVNVHYKNKNKTTRLTALALGHITVHLGSLQVKMVNEI
jgi:hypothetical protein